MESSQILMKRRVLAAKKGFSKGGSSIRLSTIWPSRHLTPRGCGSPIDDQVFEVLKGIECPAGESSPVVRKILPSRELCGEQVDEGFCTNMRIGKSVIFSDSVFRISSACCWLDVSVSLKDCSYSHNGRECACIWFNYLYERNVGSPHCENRKNTAATHWLTSPWRTKQQLYVRPL